jgi:tRNA (adenine57-N1/adenine58-N1)-methyltransferase catalytic subunit
MEICGRGSWVAKEGDLVILACAGKHVPVYLKRGSQTTTPTGTFQHNSLVGLPFGGVAVSQNNVGVCTMMRATPEVWLTNLPHRTQILYHPNVAMIVSELGIHPGSIVVESGTGSGGLTTALARAVAPAGHVYTFEFHKERAGEAEEEFARNKIGHLITVTHADACGEAGFGREIDGLADAVFLDVPNPWEAIGNAARSLKHCGRICTFSPCIEQVQKTIPLLEEHGFARIHMIEILSQELEVRAGWIPGTSIAPETTEPGDTLVAASRVVFSSTKRPRDGEDDSDAKKVKRGGPPERQFFAKTFHPSDRSAVRVATEVLLEERGKGAPEEAVSTETVHPLIRYAADRASIAECGPNVQHSLRFLRPPKPVPARVWHPGAARTAQVLKQAGHTGFLMFALYLGKSAGDQEHVEASSAVEEGAPSNAE